MMKDILKMAGSLFLIALLIAHFFLVALFVAPTERLLAMIIEVPAYLVTADDIPQSVSGFLIEHKIVVDADTPDPVSPKGQIVVSLLKLRESRFMAERERLALKANLLDYGQGVQGLSEAAELYYGKFLSELEDRQWITLFNLHNITQRK